VEIAGSRGFEMLIDGLGRTIQADREREIQERLRQRGLLRDALEAIVTGGLQATPEPRIRPASGRSLGLPARGRTR
jgi:hypothetical protein